MSKKFENTFNLLDAMDDCERLIEENAALRLTLIAAQQQNATLRAKLDGKRAEVDTLKRELAMLRLSAA